MVMLKPIILGSRFEKLVVLERAASGPHGLRYRCRCDCGKLITTDRYDLVTNHTKSCGCYRRYLLGRRAEKRSTHGQTRDSVKRGTSEYKAWQAMHQRCYNPKNKSYARYGARGIKVCEEWKSFECFFSNMGKKPGQSYSIDRIDNSGNYEPGNCRWATYLQQNNNKTGCREVTINGAILTVSQISRKYGIHKSTLTRRLNQNWTPELAVSTPVKKYASSH